MRYSLLCMLLAALFTVTGCQEGPAGAVGPEGPQGPAGPAGPTGPAGQDGQDGQDAEVLYETFAYDVTVPTNDSDSNTFNSSILTASVVEGGAVLAYFRSGESWFSLPLTITRDWNGDHNTDGAVNYQFAYREGSCSFHVVSSGNIGEFRETGTLRIVALESPGGQRLASDEPPSYEELAARYGLPLD